MAVYVKADQAHTSDLKDHKKVRGVYNGTVGGMSIAPTCESPSAH
jgi:hypothetical protein